MRRLGRLAWPLLLGYFCLALTVLAKDATDKDNVRLRVSIRKETLQGVPSCQHTFSQIELLNLHSTDQIQIHSIQTIPEETVLIRSSSGQIDSGSWEDIPQQLHVSRLPSGSLTLSPGQVAIVPVTFLPRFPELRKHDKYVSSRSSDVKTTPSLSSTAKADLLDLVGADKLASFHRKRRSLDSSTAFGRRRRNNLDPADLPVGDEFEVRTSIVIDTSRGVLKAEISASSVRQNSYGLPDVIRFHHSSENTIDNGSKSRQELESSSPSTSISADGVVLTDTIHFDSDDSINSFSLKRSDPIRSCYDLYLNNPSTDKDLEIAEILVSRPDLMSVEFDPNRLLLAPDLLVLASAPSHVIREWTEEGSMYVPADSVDNYVATVCTSPTGVERDEIIESYLEEMSNWIDSGVPEQSLGYLQIRTDAETLFVALERFDEHEESFESNAPESSPSSSNENRISATKSPSALFAASPDKLDFQIISSTSPAVLRTVDLQNKSPVPIRIMRLVVGLDTNGDESILEQSKRLGLELNVTEKSSLKSPQVGSQSGQKSWILPPANTVKDALSVSCTINVDPQNNLAREQPFNFTGTILLRGTMETELRYQDWKDEMIRDPYHDTYLTIEIPYSISVLNGRVEVTLERSTHPYPQIYGAQPWDNSGRAVSTLFFPLQRFQSVEGSEAPLPTQKYKDSTEIGHDLRVMSNMAQSLQFDRAEIVDEHGVQVFGTRSACARFNVSRSKAFQISSTYPDFHDLGYMTLQYRFDTPGESSANRRARNRGGDKEQVLPTTCYLNIITRPANTGFHRIPLVIFPAQLEVTSPTDSRDEGSSQYADTVEAGENPAKQASVSLGYSSLMSFFQSSMVGKSLLEVLDKEFDGKKNFQSDSQTLSAYIKKLSRFSRVNESSVIKPLLMKLGAIEHNEIARAPLFFTNHNPVPMTLTIDVGEVEGMTIALGRDGSQGRGDGNNLLDYLPKHAIRHSHSEYNLVSEGSFQGHPVNGLRQFLLSNEEALDFSERFPFRDAVSLSQSAILRHPFLHQLYKWHSYAEFHRNQQEDGHTTNTSSKCDLSTSPPLYSSFDTKKGQGKQRRISGAFMVSGDKKIARPLTVCSRERIDSGLASGSKILIPPGGTARFEVHVRSPPQASLRHDISQLLATGLVLSTNFGQIMPIFASFEALQGQLHLLKTQNSSNGKKESAVGHFDDASTAIDVPLGLYWHSINEREGPRIASSPNFESSSSFESSQMLPGVEIHLSSSFSRTIRLLNVESCNPWFKVALRQQDDGIQVGSGVATSVGWLHSAVSCSARSGDESSYPSFYQCALNWLADRSELQPPGCGTLNSFHKRKSGEENGLDVSHRGVRSVIEVLDNVSEMMRSARKEANFPLSREANLTQIKSAFYFQPHGTVSIKSGERRSDGLVGIDALRKFAQAWEALKAAGESGLTRISSNLRATIEYDSTAAERNDNSIGRQNLTISMHNIAIQSELEAPRLFAGQNANLESNQGAPILEFPPTLVGSTASMFIPLKNPTSVPIRVRLASAPTFSEAGEQKLDTNIRDRFLQRLPSPYVQNGKRSSSKDVAPHLWWDGGGSFFLADKRGDIVQSHQNITIKAAAGAHVSLVNPSLHAIVGFVVGCGVRCGQRDEAKVNGIDDDPKLTSPIGAAAAAGITLTGRRRASLPQANELSTEEPYILSGGTPVPGKGGPSAFALPYSALDEIVIPPFGIGEIGPVLFRPPGRFSALGCDLVRSSGANHWNMKAGELCNKNFEAMVLLENSMTGVERIVVKGGSQWEHVYFLDPPSREGEETFGNIELRNGHITLVFTGNGDSGSKEVGSKKFTPVVKQVMLHNGGDIGVEISSVYLSDTSKTLIDEQSANNPASKTCMLGSFKLLDCWESDRREFQHHGDYISNVRAGFSLKPGESRALYVEHVAECRLREEFISLSVDFARGPIDSSYNRGGSISTHVQGHQKRARNMRRNSLVQRKRLDLVVGYRMNNAQFLKCTPVNTWSGDFDVTEVIDSVTGIKLVGNETKHRKLGRGNSSRIGSYLFRWVPYAFFCTLACVTFLLLAYSGKVRQYLLEQAFAKSQGPKASESRQVQERKRHSQQSLWNAAYRCLARADPNSSELQALGREQVRQVIAGRYRMKGAPPPPSLAASGNFTRDRSLSVAGGTRQRSGKDGASGSDRVRTLSDALFGKVSSETGESSSALLSAGLGWRIAFARGIINEKSISSSNVCQATRRLLKERHGTTCFDGSPKKPKSNSLQPIAIDTSKSEPTRYDPPKKMIDKKNEQKKNEEIKAVGVGAKPSTIPKELPDEVPRLEESERYIPVEGSRNSSSQKNEGGTKRATNAPPKVNDPGEKDTRQVSRTIKGMTTNGRRNTTGNPKPSKSPRKEGASVSGTQASSGHSASSAVSETKKLVQRKQLKEQPKAKPHVQRGRNGKSQMDSSAKIVQESSGTQSKSKGGKNAKASAKITVPAGLVPVAKNLPTNTSQKKEKKKGGREKNQKQKLSEKKKPKGDPVQNQAESTNHQTDQEPRVQTDATPKASVLPPGVSPPPGLAPPPGFSQDSAASPVDSSAAELPVSLNPGPTESASLGDLLTAALNSDLNMTAGNSAPSPLTFSQQLNTSRSDLLFSGGLNETPAVTPLAESGGEVPFGIRSSPRMGNIPTSTETVRTGRSGEESNSPGDPLLDTLLNDPNNSHDGFDVMDFLDGILDDGGAQQTEVELNQSSTTLLGGTSDVPIMSNPWATEKKSRASAYGISFDDTEEVGGEASPGFQTRAMNPHEEPRGLTPIPLLTPAAILLSGQDDEDIDEDDRALSFYASLTEEE